jgi:SPP1 gp7 family putative phage head morphogenesis protein
VVDRNIPTIRPAAQARLLLYRVFSSHLGDALEKLLLVPISTWDKILDELEKNIMANFSNPSELPTLTKAFALMEKSTRKDLERQILSIAGEKLWLGVFPQGLLENFIKEHIQLIKDVRLEHLNKIASSLQRGIRQGLLQKEIARDIQVITNLSKKRVRLIARNAPLQYSGELTKHHQTSSGVKKYRWQTSQDERVRKSHRSRNRTIYSWDSPGPHPRSEVNCRCDAIPVLDF